MCACKMQRKWQRLQDFGVLSAGGWALVEGESWLLFLQPGAGVAVEGGHHTRCQPLESIHQGSW